MAFLKLTVLAVLAATILTVSYGRTLNVQEPTKETFLEKFVSHLIHPKRQDDYSGLIEFYFLELPMLLKQLGNLGDDLLLPGLHYEMSIIGTQIWDIKNPRLVNASHTAIKASMTGNQLSFNITIPSVEVQCPECIIEQIKYEEDGRSHSVMEDLTISIKNYSVQVTTNLQEQDGVLGVSNLRVAFELGEFASILRNGTHTSPDGSISGLGMVIDDYRKDLMDWWSHEETREEVLLLVEAFFNCQLSSGALEICDGEFVSPLFDQTFSQIIHGMGNAAISNTSTYSQPLADLSNPIDVVNKILFKYGTHVIQTTKIASALLEGEDVGFPVIFPVFYNATKKNCSDDGLSCQTMRDEMNIGGPEETSVLYGSALTSVICNIANNNVTYKFVAPNLAFNSTDYRRVITNLDTGSQVVYEGLQLRINQAVLGVTANFSTSGGILSFSAMKVLIKLGTARMYVPTVTLIEDGKRTELPPLDLNMGPEVSEMWNAADENGVTLEQKYSRYLQTNINDFLAGRISI